MSILFRTKRWLTVAQLARAWTAEISGPERNSEEFEQDLVHLLLEDIVNGRLDDTGSLVEGRRLGLRLITPNEQAGFVEGHQVRDLIHPGGASAWVLNRIVLMKEAALDFAQRHKLPPPSWWSDAETAPTKTTNSRAADGAISTTGLSRPRGAKPKKLERVKEAMKDDVKQGRHSIAELREMREKDLAAEYGVSRDTARKARNAVSEFVENSILDK